MEGFNGNSNYNSLQLKVQRDFSKGLALVVGYTWSKSIDDTAGSGDHRAPSIETCGASMGCTWKTTGVGIAATYVNSHPIKSRRVSMSP